MKLSYLLPLCLFGLIAVILWRGLSLNPSLVPSPLLSQKAPDFSLPSLFNPKRLTSPKDFLGKVTVVNVWATWCHACREEHPFLLELAKQRDIYFYGLNYKDDLLLAKKWLTKAGNPYQLVGTDEEGQVAMDWGVYGIPETFILDKKGFIRKKYIGTLTPLIWQQELKPLIDELQQESP